MVLKMFADAVNAVNEQRIARLERDLRRIAEIADLHAERHIHTIACRALNNQTEQTHRICDHKWVSVGPARLWYQATQDTDTGMTRYRCSLCEATKVVDSSD